MAGSIIIPLLTGFDSKGIREAETALSALGGKLKSFGKTAALSLGGALAGQGMVNFVKSSVDAAAHLQQNMTGLNTIYGASTKQIMDFVNSSNLMGMSMADSAKAMTFMGSVFKQTGMPMQDVIEHSKTMVSLGADLAATYGYSVEEALTAMTATFRGEYDPIEKFGVAMKQSQVNAELAARGLSNLKGAALIAAQQQIRYEMILQRTADAQGAFGRSSGNLIIQMQVLKATWANMQATLGSQLTPVLTQFVVKLQPLLEKMMPHMVSLFTSIGSVITNLLPLLPTLADGVASVFGMMSTVFAATARPLGDIIKLIVNLLPGILAFAAAFKAVAFVVPIVQALQVQFALLKLELKDATIAQVLFNDSAIASKGALLLQAGAVGAVAAALAIGIDYINKYNAAVAGIKGLPKNLQDQANAFADAQAKRLADTSGYADINAQAIKATALQDWYARYVANHQQKQSAKMASDWKKVMADITNSMANSSSQTGAAVKTWFDTLAEEIKKQSDRLKMQKLGASEAFINSVLGSADWNSVADKLIKGGKTAITKFQAEFNKTAAGIDAAKAAADAAAKDLADRQTKYVEAVQKRLDTIKALTSDLGSFIPKTLAQTTAQIGAFESDVISAADTLRSSLAQALDTKDTQDAYQSLLKYANTEIDTLQKLAVARDKVVARLEAAKSVYMEVAQAVRGYGNITSTTTSQVTESYKKIIDGVEVTITRTVEALQNKDLVASYKTIVDKTKAFVAQLKQLKNMGLNATLFKQIVDAGVDAGSATADAIVAGGQDTVSSLNDLFGQLDTAGAQMADMTAQVMENNGITIVSAFIDGLTAEEAALSDKATAMGKAFTEAFNSAVKLAIPQVDYTKFGLTAKQAADALTGAGLPLDQLPSSTPVTNPIIPPVTPLPTIAFSAWDSMSPEMQAKYQPVVNTSAISTNTAATRGDNSSWNANMPASTYNVTVNAGLGTDGATVGQTVVQILKQYERNNGAVWVSA
jgi:hypothetical protein